MTDANINKIIFYILFLIFSAKIKAGVMHSHTNSLNKERETDGAYSPRDHSHYEDSGRHNAEFDHEAILGSYRDAEEYDQLEPEEAKRRLAILLNKMDLNADKKIDRKELKAWILRSFRMLSEEEAKERMEDVDKDGNKIVTWAEYALDNFGSDMANENDVGLDEDTLFAIKEDKLLWKAADRNNDSQLDESEWKLFSHPDEYPEMHATVVEQTLVDRDENGDGALDFKEYVGYRGADLSKEDLHSEKVKFDDLDVDKNGKLVGAEITAWMIPDTDKIAEEETDHLFVHSDDDHDDILTFDEILEHHDIFVGSEATDYGDLLHDIHRFSDEL